MAAEDFHRELGRTLHKEVQFVASQEWLPFEAVNAPESRNVLLVNISSTTALPWLVGHELGHAIHAQHADFYNAWHDLVLKSVKDWTPYEAMLMEDYRYTGKGQETILDRF